MEMISGVPQFGPSTGNLVIGNYIGTDAIGTTAIGNGWQLSYDGRGMGNFGDGVAIEGAANNTIGGSGNAGLGNLISGNFGNGIGIEADLGVQGVRPGFNTPSSNDFVWGNYIGTTGDGNAPLGNGFSQDAQGGYGDGISIEDRSTNIQIGGSQANGLGNLIAANAGEGVGIEGGSAQNVVQGNFIGTNAAGNLPLGNGSMQDALDGGFGSGVGIDGGFNNTIGGASLDLGNLISGNAGDGVGIGRDAKEALLPVPQFGPSIGNLVVGNYIGTDATGNMAIGNGWQASVDSTGEGSYGDGVAIEGAFNNTIGGSSNSGLGNLISGNFGNGIGIEADKGVAGFWPGFNVASANDFVYGNRIGTTADGEAALGNGWAPDSKGEYGNGISIEDGSNNIQVGGASGTGLGNLISGNGGDGVSIEKNAQGNRVQGNFIGTDAQGGFAIGNGAADAKNPGNGVGIDGTNNNLIGGNFNQGLGNVISGNAGNGVSIEKGGSNNRVQGNLIGTDFTGTFAIANGWQANQQGNLGNGVDVDGSNANSIGGDALPGPQQRDLRQRRQRRQHRKRLAERPRPGQFHRHQRFRHCRARQRRQRRRGQWLEQQYDRRPRRNRGNCGGVAPAQLGQPHFRQCRRRRIDHERSQYEPGAGQLHRHRYHRSGAPRQ